MNLKDLHTENKAVHTNKVFEPKESVISLHIKKGEQLKEHITKVPAFLICVTGNAIFTNENKFTVNLEQGDYVLIEPNVKHWVDAILETNLLLIK
ncbi:cupin domain-containing protein [Flavobacterium sp. F-380]|jgi:quercetin dioxygenase-like cupin family protein|uniref:Cupin domain-containing protein n=1 Tax=Flavobacterium kayseriense TaxID=2764714 RepID=A0ABR7JAP9_9FLAO|nr:cupin domain-containing protein [Flavobacterium kayseriense]MBC5842608.1 cupin domain-containing protein [Flavobacterium kayseriense]MBC5849138.1 cupin domain-containing protein [Flavobacterium kayseriense]MBU0942128.1 cupin domain-containing protein [Bacteroidota bacterium]